MPTLDVEAELVARLSDATTPRKRGRLRTRGPREVEKPDQNRKSALVARAHFLLLYLVTVQQNHPRGTLNFSVTIL
ncbi:hypothetical protein GGP66_000668 [Salinibacter ruber]|nr:hypothetical protein [Salinibacter ruber]